MKCRMAFVASGAALGLAYLLLGATLLQRQSFAPFFVQTWTGLAAVGLIGNVIIAVVWLPDDDWPDSARRLLLLQLYLPWAIAIGAVVFACAPAVFLAAWLANALCFGPARLARALVIQRRVRARIQRAGRWMTWDTLEPLLLRGEGVLVLDSTPCRPGLVWWTDDKRLADMGLLVLADDRLRRVKHEDVDQGMERLLPLSSFQERYFDADQGRALLTPLSAVFLESKKFLRAYPLARVFAVDTLQGRMRIRPGRSAGRKGARDALGERGESAP
jgi:hypothetical protein